MQTRPNPSLRVIALFAELGDAELARIAASCSTKTYEKNAQILGDQDLTTDVFFILSTPSFRPATSSANSRRSMGCRARRRCWP